MVRANRRVIIAASWAIVGWVLLAGCDGDGDGLDDATGQPVGVAQSDSGADCPEGGVSWLQPEHCQPTGGSGQDVAFGPAPGVDPGQFAQLARHEAAHKAVADHYGWPIRSASISPSGQGAVYLRGFGLPCRCPVQLAAFALAGEVGSDVPAGDKDARLLDRALRQVPFADRDRVESEGRAEAARIVALRSAEIDRDAALLLEDGRL